MEIERPTLERARLGDYLGLFLIALATLMLEILLTRIFSVTLWYHLAFVAVSIAMFGMTLGAVVVYLFPRWFTADRAWANMAIGSAGFAVSAILSVSIHVRSAIDPDAVTSVLFDLWRAYAVSTIPFFFSGVVVSIALTQFPGQIGRLYAADLAGAALGCICLIVVLDWLGGPSSVWVIAAAGTCAALAFALGSSHQARRSHRLWLTGCAIVACAATSAAVASQSGVLAIKYAKGGRWPRPLYEKWNSYSRVAVMSDRWEEPFGWGLSYRYRTEFPVRQLRLNIDASAETVLTHFEGRLDEFDYLRYDVTNVGLYLRGNGSVYVVGAGGGRDVLSALVFGAKKVVAVEMNRAILDALNGVFGDRTGHLDRHPAVRFVNDEARSYLARSQERFDLIQISLIDTWAATAAGAFVLSENTLYTTDAWRTFLDRLTDRGLVSVSRWYRHPDPYEAHKITALATVALRESGVIDTRKHLIVVVRQDKRPGGENTPGVATLLASRTPFRESDIRTIEDVARAMDFDVVLSPSTALTPAFADVADAREVDRFVANAPFDLSAPDDDRPFFFKMDSDLLRGLLTFVVVLACGCLVLPIILRADVAAILRAPSLSIVFLGIGLGFMLIEIAQMLRLTVLLGHPTFSLSVVLFAMLLSSGAGSYSTRRVRAIDMGAFARRRFGGLIGVLVALGVVTAPLVEATHAAPTPWRVAVALLLLVPAGFLMGMAFPMAMTMAAERQPRLMPWFWGLNGAASVCASVLAVVIASNWGITAAWWSGVICYLVAALAVLATQARLARA